MVSSREEQLQKILVFVDMLRGLTEGYSVYLGGGVLRDFNYGGDIFNPKDIDVFFVPTEGSGTRTLPTVPRSYVNYDKPAALISPDMVARGVTHLRGLYVPKEDLPTQDVQFIVYDKVMTPHGLASDMSETINQIMMDKKNTYTTNLYVEDHQNQIIRQTHVYDEERMVKRLLRMKDKFPDYEIVTDIDLDYYQYLEDHVERGGSFCEE